MAIKLKTTSKPKAKKKTKPKAKTKAKTKSKAKSKTKSKAGKKPNLNKKAAVILSCCVLVSVIAVSGIFTAIGNREIEYYDFQKAVAEGIDVSSHNGEIDWETVAENVDFAFIRIGYRGYESGEIEEDENARDNIKGAQKAGIPYGVYFYSQATDEEEAIEEAKFVLKIIWRYNPELPIVIDFEYPTDSDGNFTGKLAEASLSAEENTAVINAFCEEIQSHGYASGLYASSSVICNEINADDILDDTAIWAADYNGYVTYDVDYKIWQYSRTGSCDGVGSKYVDLDYYYSKIQKG